MRFVWVITYSDNWWGVYPFTSTLMGDVAVLGSVAQRWEKALVIMSWWFVCMGRAAVQVV
jgi:hypothetical protein